MTQENNTRFIKNDLQGAESLQIKQFLSWSPNLLGAKIHYRLQKGPSVFPYPEPDQSSPRPGPIF